MIVVNVTRGIELARECQLAESIFARSRGLLWRPPLKPGNGLAIRPCTAIHTFLMTYPIDVLFVGHCDLVLYTITAMPPYRVSPPVFRSRYVVELPAGTIAASGTMVGDQLALRDGSEPHLAF
ncbi:MAG: DUF192 domain-containing protein [Chloroflexi bacterium]|nr:DUF192 domain-containing protein [Chloroflexota bacterium]